MGLTRTKRTKSRSCQRMKVSILQSCPVCKIKHKFRWKGLQITKLMKRAPKSWIWAFLLSKNGQCRQPRHQAGFWNRQTLVESSLPCLNQATSHAKKTNFTEAKKWILWRWPTHPVSRAAQERVWGTRMWAHTSFAPSGSRGFEDPLHKNWIICFKNW